MSKNNLAFIDASPSPEPANDARHLGPAEVLAVAAGKVEARIESGRVVTAELALAMPYEPTIGDRVLVIGDGSRAWVIGVIGGRGKTVLSFAGDVELRANEGVLRLASTKRVEVEAPEATFHVGVLRTVADTVAVHVASFTQRVRELMSVHAGQKREIVDGSTTTQAKSATLVTEGDVKVNGKAIFLG